MFFLLTYHTLKDIFADNPNIGLIADIAQLIVYAITLWMLFRCKRSSHQPMIERVIYSVFILLLPAYCIIITLL